jgi:AbrB family looped-hinge helix DNA binding protein
MRITSKGQVTIPIEIREKLGLLPDTDVEFELQGKTVRLVKSPRREGRSRGRNVVERLRGKGTVRMTTDEILALTRNEYRPRR